MELEENVVVQDVSTVNLTVNVGIPENVLKVIADGAFYGVKTNGAIVIGTKLKDGRDAVITLK